MFETVIEALRFSNPELWYRLESELYPSDLGTSGGVSVEDCGPDSYWINGKSWMLLPFPEIRQSFLRSVEDIQLRNEQLVDVKR